MTARMRVVKGSRGVPTTVVVRQTELDDLLNELMALTDEAIEMAERALPLARQLAMLAASFGPRSAQVGRDLIAILERQARRHEPRRAA